MLLINKALDAKARGATEATFSSNITRTNYSVLVVISQRIVFGKLPSLRSCTLDSSTKKVPSRSNLKRPRRISLYLRQVTQYFGIERRPPRWVSCIERPGWHIEVQRRVGITSRDSDHAYISSHSPSSSSFGAGLGTSFFFSKLTRSSGHVVFNFNQGLMHSRSKM